MNRRRSRAKAAFPKNLYENDGYYSYRNPVTGDSFGFGRNRSRAFEWAIQCNIKIRAQQGIPDMVAKVLGADKNTVAQWEIKYQGILAKRGLTKETLSNYLSHSRRMVKVFGEKSMRKVAAQDVSDWIDGIVEEGLPRVAQAVRQYAKHSFEQAIQAGWIDANPVRVTKIVGGTKSKRARLSLDVFMKVYANAGTWLQNAMALALVSAQRREDVCRAEFKDFKDGGWWLTQASEKTDDPHHIFIPNEIKPREFHLCLGEVVSQARRSGVLSSYVVHQTRRRGRSGAGRSLRLSTVSRAFTDAVEALGLDWGNKTPPTFHEIRSLSARLYEAQGMDPQHLLGHTDADTTAIYLNSRGTEWVKITV